jgi:hypothetical protein
MILVFAETGVPFDFAKCPDLDTFKNNLSSLNYKTDYVSIPGGKTGIELVDIMAKATFPTGSSLSDLPAINIHSGTKPQKQATADAIFQWQLLFGKQNLITFFDKNDIDFETNMKATYDGKTSR